MDLSKMLRTTRFLMLLEVKMQKLPMSRFGKRMDQRLKNGNSPTLLI
jgi:hypothetical protein